jgi:hypothetical protein
VLVTYCQRFLLFESLKPWKRFGRVPKIRKPEREKTTQSDLAGIYRKHNERREKNIWSK